MNHFTIDINTSHFLQYFQRDTRNVSKATFLYPRRERLSVTMLLSNENKHSDGVFDDCFVNVKTANGAKFGYILNLSSVFQYIKGLSSHSFNSFLVNFKFKYLSHSRLTDLFSISKVSSDIFCK